MKEHAIALTSEQVRQVLGGLKTQWRKPIRLPWAPMKLGVWEPTTFGGPGCTTRPGGGDPVPVQAAIWHTRTGKAIAAPVQVGDRLWVRETWCPRDREHHPEGGYWYAVSDSVEGRGGRSPWKSATTMPRAACRTLLEVTTVIAQPARAMTVEDAYAEGFQADAGEQSSQALTRFIARWDTVHYRTPWSENPWMWAVTFRMVQP